MKQYIAYYRVSTQKQGVSGLGLEAQRAAVLNFISGAPLVAEYTEIESGKKNNREQLTAAIAHAKQIGATLVIAKLDRLSRNAGFIFNLRDSGVDFICADLPEANTLTIGIFAVMAQHEREMISKRTKEALAAKKQREPDWQAGTPANLTPEATRRSIVVRQQNALTDENNVKAAALAKSAREQGATLTDIAALLNKKGFKTRRGNMFIAKSVQRLLEKDFDLATV
jgi:DNA invertase Pin-like site-specific DNA recombinase